MEPDKNKDFFKDIHSGGSKENIDPKTGMRYVFSEREDDDLSNQESFIKFAQNVTPPIIAELKIQNMRKKARSFGFAMNQMINPAQYQLDAEIRLEKADPILHRELNIQYGDAGIVLFVKEISIPSVDYHILEALISILNDLESEMERVRSEMIAAFGSPDIPNFNTAARRIFRITNTRHIMMITGAIYPANVPMIEELANRFFRNKPPNDPIKN